MGSIFNIFKYMNSACTVRKQYMHCSWTVNFVSESQHKWLERKKKKKRKKGQMPDADAQSKPHLYMVWIIIDLGYVWVRRLCLRLHFFVLFFLFLFSRVLGQNLLLWLLFMPCAWTVAAKFDLSNNFQPISAHLTLFTDPQISLFSNFFIKNGSHDTIHTFKNYFAIVFFSFSFQL